MPTRNADNPSWRSCLVGVVAVFGVYVLLWLIFTSGDGEGYKTDPIENRPWLWAKFRAAEREAEANLAETKREFDADRSRPGWGHVLNNEKQRILREKYGIKWRTPAEMNPHLAFD
jgi:hypothetical protein